MDLSHGNLASFNIFMNIQLQPDGILLKTLPLVTKPVDNIVLRAEMDCFVAFFACPQDIFVYRGRATSRLTPSCASRPAVFRRFSYKNHGCRPEPNPHPLTCAILVVVFAIKPFLKLVYLQAAFKRAGVRPADHDSLSCSESGS